MVTAYLGAQAENRVSTGALATSVTVSGLIGASQYTFQIVANNSYGSSPVATTNAMTPALRSELALRSTHDPAPFARSLET